ncbi:tRNA 2-selenouridine(34) synthase MnmH [Rhodobaculum claviforme]|uniref:tRNA 2-selenouridine(34) synthase MnmH n=1 Tax=Rhodobaculum claviforme TaxID=1549854 RepID=A0A934TIB9_9RHOB|nr:tRNA 2-selenouridine(34) synthase MnmH [Rhodobaculum claviforme]MBK5926735.1 tRNA 2-selenouridine(34) synthase MnmH [Rhodobaculum claviforme]
MSSLLRPLRLTDPAALGSLGVDDVIDVRSPAEYAEDHLPGAINLPVLDDAERARVGTIYVQQCRFLARRIGGALVARNVAGHLEGALADRPQGWHPLVYCWRGGQRSGSFATILAQVGWRVGVLEGGYRSWRRLVVRDLYDGPLRWRLVLVDGNTGTAKTELLHLAAARGTQVLDLEGLARHRGSVFGADPAGQPAQKGFESALMAALSRLDPARPVLVEAESPRLGALTLPPALWAAMRTAPRIEITAPLPARAHYLARAYAEVTADRAALSETLDRLRPFQPAERIAHWHDLAAAGQDVALAAALMAEHYDPLYARARARQRAPEGGTPGGVLATDRLDPPGLEDLADRLADAVARGPLSAGCAPNP